VGVQAGLSYFFFQIWLISDAHSLLFEDGRFAYVHPKLSTLQIISRIYVNKSCGGFERSLIFEAIETLTKLGDKISDDVDTSLQKGHN